MTVRDLEHFENWLTDNGAEVMAPTSEWEVLRVNTSQGVFVVHRNKRGDQSWPPGLLAIVSVYNKNGAVPLAATRRKRKSSKLRQQFGSLVRRDGPECFYCGDPVPDPEAVVPSGMEATTEHLVSVCHGGPDHISNKFLAHRDCNAKARNMSAPEKIRMREQMRSERVE